MKETRIVCKIRRYNSAVETAPRLDDRGIEVRFPAGGEETFRSQKFPDRLCGPPLLIVNGLCRSYPTVKKARFGS
jgi:hypothetical protein